MFTPQAVSHPYAESHVSIPRRPWLDVLGALVAIALIAVTLSLTSGSTADHAGPATASHAGPAASGRVVSHKFTLPHIAGLDMAPSPSRAAQIMRASVPAGFVRDARTHSLLRINITPETVSQPAATRVVRSVGRP